MLDGICAMPVQVEVDISMGMPVFDMVGYLSPEVREAKERVRTALHNCGILLPAKRITVNLSPANIRKTGTGFDLPIAVALLVAMGLVKPEKCADTIFSGELNLSGQLLPVRGILPMVSDGVKEGIHKFVVPADNLMESRLVQGADVCGFSALESVIGYLQDGGYKEPAYAGRRQNRSHGMPDFSEVNGQQFLKRAAEIAASGMHNMLMVGPPGAGKTMISERMATILPPLTKKEQLEVSKIYSVCGLLADSRTLLQERPFRSPHHTVSMAGLAGGGRSIRPGEISLAHHGVLFLDELPEFSKSTMEVLRQPLEDGEVSISRVRAAMTFPSKFILCAAQNPCPCGFLGDSVHRCSCKQAEIDSYKRKISGPLMDRIDMQINLSRVEFSELKTKEKGESSAAIRERVVKARLLQQERLEALGMHCNAQMGRSEVVKYCQLDAAAQNVMERYFNMLNLSARSHDRILKVARTIADLAGSESIEAVHLAEAIQLRTSVRP